MKKTSHDHGLEHSTQGQGMTRGLILGIALNLLIVVVEVVIGLMANSLGLLSDAVHNFTDIAALAIVWFAFTQAKKPPTAVKTFGYHRTGILTALINALVMVLVTVWIFYEAYQRFINPQPVGGALVMITAGVALIANLAVVAILRSRGSGDLNIRSAMLHLLSDAATSAAVVVAGLIIIATGWYPIDPLVSVMLGLAILWGAWKIIEETLEIFLEEAPRAVDVNRVVAEMKGEDGVIDVHDIHVWTIGSQLYALSAHVLVEDIKVSESNKIMNDLREMLSHDFGIVHSTLEVESSPCENGGPYCDINNHTVRVSGSKHRH
ncbi:MAG: cation diffusion facilitator family transporter [Actinobacteria bacterium]|nr:cation diffusion facilitator family transporter [Actinomycetota bacterium]